MRYGGGGQKTLGPGALDYRYANQPRVRGSFLGR